MVPLAVIFPLAAVLSAAEPDWLELIPAELRERPAPLAEAKNAYPLWLKAIRRLEEGEAQDLRELIREACKEDAPFPGGETGRKLREWLERHQDVRDLMDQGLARGQFRFPEWKGEKGFTEVIFPFFFPGGLLFEMRLLRANLLASEGDLPGAGEELRRLLRSSELLQGGAGPFLSYLAGSMRQIEAFRAIRCLARRNGIPASLLEELLPLLGPSEREGERPAETVRAEFQQFFLGISVDAAPEGADLKTMALAFASSLEGKKKQDFVDGFCALLEGHPLPFDRKETMLLGAREYALCLKNLKAPWSQRQSLPPSGLEAEIQAWPVQLRPYPSSFGEERDPLADDKLAAARKALARVQNPVGKCFFTDGSSLLEGLPARLYSLRAEREATRAVVALHIHSLRRGRLPDSLQVLVEEKLLPAVPEDPFSGKPLGYSREKRLLWSVGPEGKEDGRGGLREADGKRREGVFEVLGPDEPPR